MLDRLAGMFAFALLEIGSGRCVLVRDRLGIKPLYLAELPGGGLRAASTLPALLAAGGVDTSVDPVALHHYLSWHSVVPAPRTILNGVRKLAARHAARRSSPTAAAASASTGTRRTSATRRPLRGGVARRAAGRAARRRAAADGLRRAGRRAALRRAGLEPDRGAAGRAGPARAGDVLDRLPRRGRPRGQRVRVLGPRRASEFGTDHHQIRVGTDELVEALPQAIAAMSEPMVSHDCVAFWLLAQAVSRERKVVQSGQGADEVLGGYSWYPPLLDAPGSGLDAYAAEFFDRDHDGSRAS